MPAAEVPALIALLIAILLDNMITLGLRKTDIRKFATWNEIYKGGIFIWICK